jgi:hypothetical protein
LGCEGIGGTHGCVKPWCGVVRGMVWDELMPW